MLRTLLITLALTVVCISGCRTSTSRCHPCGTGPTVVGAAPCCPPPAPCCPTPGGVPYGAIPVPAGVPH